MYGDLGWFGEIFAAVPDGDITYNDKVARAAVKAGLAVVLLRRGEKVPVCTLTPAELKRADAEAQRAAREADSPNWEKIRHECGIKHAITVETVFNRKRPKELLAHGANLAIAPGAGTRRVIVVDIDSSEQNVAFLVTCAVKDTDTNYLDTPYSVTSPGTRDDEGNWIHSDGGHYWFDVPEDFPLPGNVGKYAHPDGWVAYWGSGYVLVPPSVREEGAYRCTGRVRTAPAWLLELIEEFANEQSHAKQNVRPDTDDPIDQWSAETTWQDLLTHDGWEPDAHDTCGCPTYTRPGSPAHAKSATGHEAGCGRYDTSGGHGPLHLWSDALAEEFGRRTLSKMSYVTQARYGGELRAALEDLGLAASGDEELTPAPAFDPGHRRREHGPKVPAGYLKRAQNAIKTKKR